MDVNQKVFELIQQIASDGDVYPLYREQAFDILINMKESIPDHFQLVGHA